MNPQQQQLISPPQAISPQPASSTLAPGNPIGYAPIYGPPLADAPTTPATTLNHPSNNAPGKRWFDGLMLGCFIGGTVFALMTWGVLDNLYAGADIRGLQRAANAANTTAELAEQRAANAEVNAQAWEQHSQQQQSQLDQIREVLGCK